ncbi:hypothetical protein [Shewanella baltica]|uniref:hypothetical protein n=1 Tax=Shewanella baltica TaxID=62322 RepID=UPI003D78D622
MASFLLNKETIIKEIENLSKLELIIVRRNLEEVISLIEAPSENFWDLIEAQGIDREDFEKLILKSSKSSKTYNPNRKPRQLKLENQSFLINEDNTLTLKNTKPTKKDIENGIVLTKYPDLSDEHKLSAKIIVDDYNNDLMKRRES